MKPKYLVISSTSNRFVFFQDKKEALKLKSALLLLGLNATVFELVQAD